MPLGIIEELNDVTLAHEPSLPPTRICLPSWNITNWKDVKKINS